MAKISFVIPCEPSWSEGIYQLEVSDPVLGYDPVLATDGPANRQGKELDDRTLYLRKLLEIAHNNGLHNLKADDFAEDAVIPEGKLALDAPTGGLASQLDDLSDQTKKAVDLLSQRNNEDLSPTYLLGRLLPWIQEYFDNGASFDLFDAFSMLRTFKSAAITKEIAGDDSLDITDTKGIIPGQTYFLMDEDGENLEEAEVLSVLTDTRIRFTSSLQITRSSGILSSVNISGNSAGTGIHRDFTWYSSLTDQLCGSVCGKLHIHRDKTESRGRVFWQEENGLEWVESELAKQINFYDGTVDDVFMLPAKALRLRVEYPASMERWKIYWIALRSITKFILPETVRQPEIEELELSGQTLTVKGNPFASLWNLPQGGLELRLYPINKFEEQPVCYSAFGETQSMVVNISPKILAQAPLAVSIRYSDCEGKPSRWSSPQELPIETAAMENKAWA